MKLVVICAFVGFLALGADYTKGEEFQCKPGVPYIENECDSCICSEKLVLGCTQMACSDPRYSELFNCQVGTTSQKGLNTCWCVKDLGTICTNTK